MKKLGLEEAWAVPLLFDLCESCAVHQFISVQQLFAERMTATHQLLGDLDLL